MGQGGGHGMLWLASHNATTLDVQPDPGHASIQISLCGKHVRLCTHQHDEYVYTMYCI